MRVKMKAFPAVYLTTVCSKHDKVVAARVDTNGGSGGASLTVFSCQVGGPPGGAEGCEDSWEVIVSGSGSVTVLP